MAPPPSYSLFHGNPFSLHLLHSQMHDPIFFFAFLASLSLLSLTFLSFSIYKRFSKTDKQHHHPPPPQNLETPNDPVDDGVPRPGENAPTHLTSSVFLEVLPSDSAKWACLFEDRDSVSSAMEVPGAEQRGKKKRKKGKKKKANSGAEESEGANTGSDPGVHFESGCLYPFTSSSSAMQRRIKLQYDELVKCNESKKLTLAQVVQFANCLVDVRNELQHKADAIQRKFVITKALLCKADRSSFDRLRQQIYKLELEQKRLEEDAFVYNSLQQQLKLSPAYQKMLEVGACMDKAKSRELVENRDDEFADISFEELLAQEKKDSFWQKNGKSRLC
ncbi:hypothetical protein HN51_042668 [Arachis hypogaea]|uniref:CA-responsive protein n=1 Tax=Arachis hypogaea TaxID=3818 RepID=A0A444Y906_ARAHY|nr:uncharacterized protein LOC107612880 [Arachis ipaensis]XP_025672876.1 uncharacterized protein LOC112772197 [Arachis hypogaea]QHN94802.1 CA-responsive protein, putative [Arachis hypogaea]RYQ98336.1 hypothetical protein Ahy_B08g094388 [Arachis hypogaea]